MDGQGVRKEGLLHRPRGSAPMQTLMGRTEVRHHVRDPGADQDINLVRADHFRVNLQSTPGD